MASATGIIDLTSSPPSSSNPTLQSRSNIGYTTMSNFQPRMGAKKLLIKNLRPTSRISHKDYADRIWGQLDAALTAILGGRKGPHSLEELYRGVENVCRHGGAQEMFDRLKARLVHYLREHVRGPLLSAAAGSTDDGNGKEHVELLSLVQSAWLDSNEKMLLIRSIFFYMDRSFLLPSRTNPTISELGETLFRDLVLQDEQLEAQIVNGILCLFAAERRYNGADRQQQLLKASIEMVHKLHVYSKIFEPRFLEASKTFFDAMAKDLVAKNDLATYVSTCDSFRVDELARCGYFDLDSRTKRDLVVIMDDSLVKKEVDVLTTLLDFAKLLDVNDMDTLDKLYTLLQRVDCHVKLRNAWETYIKSSGTSIVLDDERDGEMVVRLLELKTKLDEIWRTAFHKHEELGHVLRESFASFINERKKNSRGGSSSKPGEMIAKHVDLLLRGGSKAIPAALIPSTAPGKRLPSALSSIGSGRNFGEEEDDVDMVGNDEDAELNQQLDAVLDLFRLIEGKDVFEAFYKKDLARRLLMARSASADAERTMLARLKNECGSGFTHNLEQMFKDVDLARDEMASYKAMRVQRGHSEPSRLDLNVNVLSEAAWPTYPNIPVTIPDDISRAIADYEDHYKKKHTGRRLTWKHSLAHCVLRAHFPKGNKELGVSSFQAIVLLLFNNLSEGEFLSYAQIQSATGLTDVELTRTLQSLACARHRPITKTPRGRDIQPLIDTFSYNPSFTSPLHRIKINQIQLRETPAENLATHDDVQRDRQYETQAAIVRIMKGLGPEGTISFAELQSETIQATRKRGALGGGEIKQQIEKLIEKEYIERVGGGRFRYLA